MLREASFLPCFFFGGGDTTQRQSLSMNLESGFILSVGDFSTRLKASKPRQPSFSARPLAQPAPWLSPRPGSARPLALPASVLGLLEIMPSIYVVLGFARGPYVCAVCVLVTEPSFQPFPLFNGNHVNYPQKRNIPKLSGMV